MADQEIKQYQVGDDAICQGTFQTSAGVNQDPSSIFFQYRNPVTAVVVTEEYGVDAQPTRSAEGVYVATVDCVIAGTWYYRFYSTGTGKGAEWHEFIVQPNMLV